MLNDYHALRLGLSVRQMPDDMIHDLANTVELKALELGLKVQELAIFYESLKRREPKIHGVTIEDALNVREKVG